ADVRFSGALPDPGLEGRIWVTGLELGGDPVTNSDSEIRLSTRDERERRHYRIDADIVHALKIAADIRPNASGSPIGGDIGATIEDLQRERLTPSFRERGIASHVSGGAKVAPPEETRPLEGQIPLDRLSAEFAGKKIDAAEPIRLDL